MASIGDTRVDPTPGIQTIKNLGGNPDNSLREAPETLMQRMGTQMGFDQPNAVTFPQPGSAAFQAACNAMYGITQGVPLGLGPSPEKGQMGITPISASKPVKK